MLWTDIALGFVLAGAIAAFVPESWWAVVFATGGTLEAVLLNTVIGVVIGIVTFMCSVGNVPFALVLWRSGLPFGGVLSFIYADLLIPPLVNMYRRYYGWRLAAVLSGSIFVAAVVAGVLVHYLLGGVGLVPPHQQTGGTLSGGYTAVLNLLFTPIFLGQVYVTYGPERIEEFLTTLPTKIHTEVRKIEMSGRFVGTSLWEFCLDVAEALLLVAEAGWLVFDALRTFGTGLWLVGEAVVSLLRNLWDAGSRLF